MGSQDLASRESKEEAAPSLPPSSASSPSHDFSFAVSLHPPFNLASDKCSKIDLAPADDIFFHGHLLPLQPHSISTISPRTSSEFISINNLTHPLEHTASDRNLRYRADVDRDDYIGGTKERSKPKSFSSLFGYIGKWRKEDDAGERDEEKRRRRRRKKKGLFDVGRLLKKYMSIVEPLLFFKAGGEKDKGSLRQRPYSSFSGHPNPRERDGWRRRRGEFSAPASMRTSPTSSGLLSATSGPLSSSTESTTEELQRAIEEAITHCKNSIAGKKRV